MDAYKAVSEVVEEAKRIDSARRINARHMAKLLRGHLQHADADDLAALKKELRDFNIHTGNWKP
jgi:hypothetical protein